MPGPLLYDRVRETTTTTGTGTLTLAGAVSGFQSFAVVGNGNTCYYAIALAANWEVGIGTYTAAGTTLSRDTVLASSNGGAAVNWPSGTKDVFLTAPAAFLRPLTTAGDVLYQAANGRPTRLPIGAETTVLMVASGLPAWGVLDLSGYALLAGRAGGQTLIGGTSEGDDLTLRGSSHATPGDVITLGTHVVRQIGGTPDVDQVEISYDGTGGLVETKDGSLSLQAANNSITIGGATIQNVGAWQVTAGRVSANSMVMHGDANVFTLASNVQIRWTDGTINGTADTILSRVSAAVMSLTSILELPQVASGGTSSTNSGRLYSLDVAGTAEVHAKDEAGNEVQLTRHAFDGPDWLYDAADPLPEVAKIANYHLGIVIYTNDSRERELNRLSRSRQPLPVGNAAVTRLVETFAEHNARLGKSLVQVPWTEAQEEHQAKYDADRADEQTRRDTWDAERAAEEAAAAVWDALPKEEREGRRPVVRPLEQRPTVREAADIRKQKPTWLAARGG